MGKGGGDLRDVFTTSETLALTFALSHAGKESGLGPLMALLLLSSICVTFCKNFPKAEICIMEVAGEG